MTRDPLLVLYGATVRSIPLADRPAAARAAGCEALSLLPYDLLLHERRGGSLADVRARADDAGVAVTRLEPFLRWTPVWEPPNAGPRSLDVLGCDEPDLFRLAGALGVRSVTVTGMFPAGALSDTQVQDCLGAFAARAADRGLACDVEFLPFTPIRDLAAARRLVAGIGDRSCGIVFDLWHYVRGGGEPDLAAALRDAPIGAVQLCDGSLRAAAGLDPLTETVTRRALPGDGEFPVDDLVRTLHEVSGIPEMGLEVLSDALDALPPAELIDRCRNGLDRVLHGCR